MAHVRLVAALMIIAGAEPLNFSEPTIEQPTQRRVKVVEQTHTKRPKDTKKHHCAGKKPHR